MADVDFEKMAENFLESTPPPKADNAPKEQAPPPPAQPQVPAQPPEQQPAVEPPAAPPAQLDSGGVPDDILPDDIRKQIDAAGKQAPPKPAAEEEDEEAPPETSRDPKARNAWTKSKQEKKQLKEQLASAQAELEKLRQQASTPPAELEQAKRDIAAYEERIGKLDLTQSAAFKKQFDQPMNQLYQASYNALVTSGMQPEQAKAALQQMIRPGADLNESQSLLEGYPPVVLGTVVGNVQRMQDLQKQRAGALQDWKATRALMKEEEQRQAQTQLQAQMEAHVANAIGQVQQEGSWMFKQSPANQAWNAGVQQRIDTVKGVLKTGTPDVLAKYVAEGVAAKAYRDWGTVLAVENKKLKAQLEAMSAIQPGLGGSRMERPPQAGKPKAPTTPEAYLDEAFG